MVRLNVVCPNQQTARVLWVLFCVAQITSSGPSPTGTSHSLTVIVPPPTGLRMVPGLPDSETRCPGLGWSANMFSGAHCRSRVPLQRCRVLALCQRTRFWGGGALASRRTFSGIAKTLVIIPICTRQTRSKTDAET